MIRIGIVDDEAPMLELVRQTIVKSVNAEENIEVHTFLAAEALLNRLEQGMELDILFTDVQMPGINGLMLAEEIRDFLPKTLIVFISSYSEYAVESYVIEAYQYILKQDMEYRIPVVVRQAIEKIKKDRKGFKLVGTTIDKRKIYYSDIIYICKTKGAKYVEYITIGGTYRERTTLEQVILELHSKEFIAVERRYIVNMKYINELSGNVIYLENDNQVVISKARMTKVKKTINLYWSQL